MKKPLVKATKGQYPLSEMDPKAFEKLVGLRSFFMDAEYGDGGGEREPGCLILRSEKVRWSVTLKDSTACTQLYLACPTLADVWKLADAVIVDPDSPWVTDPWALSRRPRGRSKRP